MSKNSPDRPAAANILLFVVLVLVMKNEAFAQLPGKVTSVPAKIKADFKLNDFYKKCVDYNGFPIVSSNKVPDVALLEATFLIDKMLGNRPDILKAMINNKVRFAVMAKDEWTTDIPEHRHLKPKTYWDKRARGLGATPAAPCVSCGEENLLRYTGDKYHAENILIHEFAHAIHEMGMSTVDPKFDGRLENAFDAAIKNGKWKGTYAATNHREYFAEAVQSWFHCNRINDHQHNHVNSRKELNQYDPGAAKMVEFVFPDNPWVYARPDERKIDLEHLKGFDRKSAPKFVWPPNLKDFDAYQWERDQKEAKEKTSNPKGKLSKPDRK
jgi:hypothetical protein